MLLSNLTFCVSNIVADNFEHWIKIETKQSYIACVDVKIYKLMTKVDENSENFSVQFFFSSDLELSNFESKSLNTLIKNTSLVFGSEFAFFQTLLRVC